MPVFNHMSVAAVPGIILVCTTLPDIEQAENIRHLLQDYCTLAHAQGAMC